MELDELLLQPESEWLDFKQEHHKNTVELLHDILCLANSWTKRDRYLIFGVTNSGEVLGVENNEPRRTCADIYDLLRQSHLNKYPKLSMETYDIDESRKVDVLSIANLPEKPYFVTQDKTKAKHTVRAGVIYTRLGDTNIPMKESSSESTIELLWRERFGLDQTPLQQVQRLLDNPSSWIKIEGDNYIYNDARPEFVLKTGETLVEDFSTPWSKRFPDSSASSYSVELYYLNTILRKYTFVLCDGNRYRIPLPEHIGDRYIINAESDQWKIAQIYWQYFPIGRSISSVGIELINER